MAVTRLTLVLTEDYGGQADDSGGSDMTAKSKQPLQADLGELVSSLTLSVGAPPFLQGLLSSLQQCASTAKPSKSAPTLPTQHPARGEGVPTDISQMMAALRQLRPKTSERPTPPPPDRENGVAETCIDDQEMKSDVEDGKEIAGISLSSIEAMVDRKIGELEARLRSYVDAKVKAVMSHIETNLEQTGTIFVSSENRMVTRGREREESGNGEDSQNRTQNGLLHFEDQLD